MVKSRWSDDREIERLCGLRADRFVGRKSLSPAHLRLLTLITLRLALKPKLRLRIGLDEEGASIRTWLDRNTFGFRTPLHEAVSVIRINRRNNPLEGSGYSTLRRMERKALKLGVALREIPDRDERRHLLDLANDFERNHPDERYRRSSPNTEGLEAVRMWFGAFSADGEPLVLSVTPVSGNVGLLRYFRTTRSSEVATLARYALTAELIRQLAHLRVRYLVDNQSPIALPSNLRHFASMVGFRIVRAEICSAQAASRSISRSSDPSLPSP